MTPPGRMLLYEAWEDQWFYLKTLDLEKFRVATNRLTLSMFQLKDTETSI